MRAREVQNFKQDGDPYQKMNIGFSKYANNAQIYNYPQQSTWMQLDPKTQKAKKQGSSDKKYWIMFPEINYQGTLIFMSKNNIGDLELVSNPRNATHTNIDWHVRRGEDPIDEKIGYFLKQYYVKNVDTLLDNIVEATRDEYIKISTV